MTTTTKKPIAYGGTGSAIDNYLSPNPVDGKNWAIFDKNNAKHKVILSLLYQMQWTEPSDKYGEIPDLERLSNFLKSDKSPVKKPLKEMQPNELEKIITALNGIVKHRYK